MNESKVSNEYEVLLSAQIQIIRLEINSLEMKISAFETDPIVPFNPVDARYIRWVNEKILLQKNLHEILLGISTLARDDTIPSAGPNLGLLDQHEASPPAVPGLDNSAIGRKSKNRQTIEYETDNMVPETEVIPEDPANNKHGLQIKEYTQQKKNIKMIWRDFSNNRIHFKSADGEDRDIYISDYQVIVEAIKMMPVKNGEDGKVEKNPEKHFIKGEVKSFKTTINLKTNEFSYTELFTPFYEKGGFTQVRKKKQV